MIPRRPAVTAGDLLLVELRLRRQERQAVARVFTAAAAAVAFASLGLRP